MICIKLRMLAGRYHATPWGRNANEGVPEWPPSSFRLCRAIYDAWKRRFPELDEDRMRRIMAILASERPEYWMPPANASHLRVYLNENSKANPFSKQKVFDPFIVVAPQDEIGMTWPNLSFDEEDRIILDRILRSINYLGRSESWCDMSLSESNHPPNCRPEGDRPLNENEVRIRVAGLTHLDHFKPVKDRKGNELSWLDSIALSSKNLEKMGLDTPPALQFHDYLLDANCLGVKHRTQARSSPIGTKMVVYHMESKVKVQVSVAVMVAERVRRKLMGVHKRIMGDPNKVSIKFSGKDRDGVPLKDHMHCYICPMDLDNDGFLDHLSIRCKEHFDPDELLTLDRLENVHWSGDHSLLFTPIKMEGEDSAEMTRSMVSRTPYVSPRHHRKGRGDFMDWLKSELRRDLREMGLPEPVAVEPLLALSTLRGEVQWFEFVRSRKDEAANFGYGFKLLFDRPVPLMINVGYASHYGLGLFVQDGV